MASALIIALESTWWNNACTKIAKDNAQSVKQSIEFISSMRPRSQLVKATTF